MGGLKKYLPVTFMTMMIGTLAIAGIFPLSGFFSKDEILYRAFVHNKLIWGLAVITAMMTAFYMFRLMAMTFYGGYRGPAWEAAGHADHHAPAATPGGHGHGAAHGADEPQASHGAGHGHGAWHGPHESPTPMTFPLMALAVGAIVAGFVGVPAAIGGGNAIEHFLEPSFTASEHAAVAAEPAAARAEAEPAAAGHAEEHESVGVERGLMVFSLLVAIAGILLARKFYITSPEISEGLAEQWSGAHRTLLNKYYVDELYNATAISGTFASGRALWSFDKTVVDGGVNGAGWLTIVSSWLSGLTDRYVVDGAVNLVGWSTEESSYWFRRLQTGLVQNYALLMVFGVFFFVSVYLLW